MTLAITIGTNSRPSQAVGYNACNGPAELAAERKYLRRVAFRRLRDEHLAEDAVQETLIAALKAIARFQGRASLRTWLVAILRNKINDLIASNRREVSGMEQQIDVGSDRDADHPTDEFDECGTWREASAPQAWADPQSAMQSRQFWTVLDDCLSQLPGRTAEVFRRREVEGEEIADICAALGITASNCSVMLFRARTHLRAALQERWFAELR